MANPFPLWPGDARQRVASARVGSLATVRPDGRPHLVPVTYALRDDAVVTAVDGKPKTTTGLQRIVNIRAEPRVSLLVDHYDEDWRTLWWVRLDGTARVVLDEPERSTLLEPLLAKYAQYAAARPRGPVVAVAIDTVRTWSAEPDR